MILRIEAFDWNCPQHITPRLTIEEIKRINLLLYENMKKLGVEIKLLKGIKDEARRS